MSGIPLLGIEGETSTKSRTRVRRESSPVRGRVALVVDGRSGRHTSSHHSVWGLSFAGLGLTWRVPRCQSRLPCRPPRDERESSLSPQTLDCGPLCLWTCRTRPLRLPSYLSDWFERGGRGSVPRLLPDILSRFLLPIHLGVVPRSGPLGSRPPLPVSGLGLRAQD